MELSSDLLGNAIRSARIEKHISQESLAELSGITPTHIKHIESGHRKPSVDLLFRLVQILNLSLDSIFFPDRVTESKKLGKIRRLLCGCDEKQLKIVLAVLEAMT